MNLIELAQQSEQFLSQQGDRRRFLQDSFKIISANNTTICPIYYYHEVNIPSLTSFVVGLLQNGWHPIKLGQLYSALQTGEISWPQEKQPFILSFDDGLLSQKNNAVPFLADWMIPAVFCVMPDWQGDGRHRYMGNSDFQELISLGMEVISHTFHHPHLPRLRPENWGSWAAEIVESKKRLEDIIGTSVDFFCYLMGAYDRPTVELVAENYAAALSTRNGSSQYDSELFILRRWKRS